MFIDVVIFCLNVCIKSFRSVFNGIILVINYTSDEGRHRKRLVNLI